ncbi:MAG TPA: copper amine oxidase N-terminal domain-containing protein [Fimbriimonadales bacterium]|nr:copper amine oxidase N-terminal domain-containing protein [Fimbriimonadales bacterium]
MKAKIIVTLLGFCWTVSSFAQAIGVEIDGNPIQLTVAPRIVDNRVLVPFREIFEHLGAFVEWRPSTRTIYARKGDNNLELRVGSMTAKVNGSDVSLDVPAQIFGGYTYIPLRFVSESLGYDVNWKSYTRTVEILTLAHR